MDHGRDRPRLMLSSRAPNAASRNMGGNMRRSRLAASRVRRPYSLVKQPYTTHRRTFRRLNLRIAGSKATQRLTISHLKIRLLVCEACGARQLAWAEPYRSLPGLVVVEPVE